MDASVVISYYKNLPKLEIILLALNEQSSKNFEIIVSEDDDAPETIQFIEQIKTQLFFPIIHLSQHDDGFRKCEALNRAITNSTSDFIIFLDGDCVPHKHLVKEYVSEKRVGRALYGRRVMLSKKISEQLLQEKKVGILNFFKILFSGSKRIEEGFYLKLPQKFIEKTSGILLGCNMGISKSDLIAINGFDEDYIAPGCGEDSDIEWRLRALGTVSFVSMKFRAIVYHIHHQERFTNAMELKNQEILSKKIAQGFFVCKNGLKKLL
ncbi:MAG: glycosyltransferase [Cyclobacteriaceae bacterium]